MPDNLKPEQTFYGGDSELTEEQRAPCYAAWTFHRDSNEAQGDSADICDFRAGFMYGWLARVPDTELIEALESARPFLQQSTVPFTVFHKFELAIEKAKSKGER
jgi:hypothetical protein